MNVFKSICIKCGCKLIYEYKENDTDIGKIKVDKLCFECIEKTNEFY